MCLQVDVRSESLLWNSPASALQDDDEDCCGISSGHQTHIHPLWPPFLNPSPWHFRTLHIISLTSFHIYVHVQWMFDVGFRLKVASNPSPIEYNLSIRPSIPSKDKLPLLSWIQAYATRKRQRVG